ncbi:phosphotransferase [Pseudonocardia spinosispora]|uniref:phosphotransferase n=1 Tax=Pseudonocardia spinosispora TaxID=103441 RepID=UPI0003FA99CD|nr:phosphotransferase [Pseudonocardia spinosispora]
MSTAANATDLGPVLAAARATGLGGSYEPMPDALVTEQLEHFHGLTGTVRRIATEKDETFVLSCAQGRYLVKISSPHEALPDIELQTAAMLHVRDAAPGLPVQLPVAGLDGRYGHPLAASGHTGRLLRVLTYLPGGLLADADPAPGEVRDIGRVAARLARVLDGFSHPRQDRTVIWDLTWFDRMRPLLSHISDPADRALADSVFTQFEALVVPRLPELPRQVVHGDFSPYNLLVRRGAPGYVTGVIDFGDVVRTARAFDVAVGMANLLCDDPGDPWAKAVHFVEGYLDERALTEGELALLGVCAKARVVLRVLMALWRAVEDPARRDYLHSHSVKDWTHLHLAHAVPLSETTRRLHAAGTRNPQEGR